MARTTSDEALDRKYAEAIRRGEETMRTEPQAEAAKYDEETRRLVIDLKNGTTLMVPADLIQGLRGAPPPPDY